MNSLFCWGKTLKKRLLNSKIDPKDGANVTPALTILPDREKFVSVSYGKYHGALVTSENRIYTWGFCKNGRLGNPLART